MKEFLDGLGETCFAFIGKRKLGEMVGIGINVVVGTSLFLLVVLALGNFIIWASRP